MTRTRAALVALVMGVIAFASPMSQASARGHGHHAAYHHAYHPANYAYGVPRDGRGRIRRSSSARHRFEAMTGHPHGWKGHVIDHVVPLKRGGADDPSNMQWQTKAEAKAKDKWE